MNRYENTIPEVVKTVRAASSLAAQDVTFHASLDSSLALEFTQSAQSLLDIANSMLEQCSVDYTSIDFGKDLVMSKASWKLISDAVDATFEKIDIAMDALKGGSSTNLKIVNLEEGGLENIPIVSTKPQVNFKVKVDNSDSGPFKPKLTSKPHAKKPYEESMQIILPDANNVGLKDFPTYAHPYEFEIMNSEFPTAILLKAAPIPPTDWNLTNAIWVNSIEGLSTMIKNLKCVDEIAVDLEHHDYRSYYGITCLMQISSRTDDWLVDTIALRGDLQQLNEVFADPSIIKVFHGANMDIIWLQRDLGLYVVSLFDTYHASRALGFPKFSLAYLLETFANFKTSKKYQLADWRVRPLPKVMENYARADTHFLLYIFDQLRNRLVDSGHKLQEVLYLSRKVATRKFEYISFQQDDKDSWQSNFNEGKSERWLMSHFNIPELRFSLVLALVTWRDKVARDEDESTRFVMSNQNLAKLCSLNLPVSNQTIIDATHGQNTLVRAHSKELADIVTNSIKDAVENIPNSELTGSYRKEQVDANLASWFEKMFQNVKFQDQPAALPSQNILVEKSELFGERLENKFALKITDSSNLAESVPVESIASRAKRLRTVHFMVRQTDLRDKDAKLMSPEEVQNDETSSTLDEQPRTKDQNLVILKGRNFAKRIQKSEAKVQDEPVFDYASVDSKFLEKPEKDAGKKRSFNPYGKQGMSGPQAPKRKKILHSGKSASFKTKK